MIGIGFVLGLVAYFVPGTGIAGCPVRSKRGLPAALFSSLLLRPLLHADAMERQRQQQTQAPFGNDKRGGYGEGALVEYGEAEFAGLQDDEVFVDGLEEGIGEAGAAVE